MADLIATLKQQHWAIHSQCDVLGMFFKSGIDTGGAI